MIPKTPSADRTTAIARAVRRYLLGYAEAPRDLAGQCGLAAMLVVVSLEDPRALRTGFYMKRRQLFGKHGRYPHQHAWCRVEQAIVDVTATQFSRHNRAVHVALDDTRYIEYARGAAAIDDIMTNWCGCESPAYAYAAEGLRQRLRRVRESPRKVPLVKP